MEGPDFIPTLSPQQPVLVEGGWTRPGHGEVKKYIQVHQLQVCTIYMHPFIVW